MTPIVDEPGEPLGLASPEQEGDRRARSMTPAGSVARRTRRVHFAGPSDRPSPVIVSQFTSGYVRHALNRYAADPSAVDVAANALVERGSGSLVRGDTDELI